MPAHLAVSPATARIAIQEKGGWWSDEGVAILVQHFLTRVPGVMAIPTETVALTPTIGVWQMAGESIG